MVGEKFARLQDIIRSYGRVAVAFSGGVDSTLLLRAAAETLGPQNVLAVIGDSPSMPRREKSAAESLAAAMGVEMVVVETCELDDSAYVANPDDRCYFCKKTLFGAVRAAAAQRGFGALCDGQNADDTGDWRPGGRAVRECGAHSPLLEAGLTKDEIRLLSQRFNLPTAAKPAMACLASRIPYGTPVTAATLRQIELAEVALQDMGFALVRVRHHEKLARIEVGPADFARLLDAKVRQQVVDAVHQAGYTYVSLDLEGYRSGSLNAHLKWNQQL